jgi:uncharacterized protein YjbI with pentapeptide repeats
VIEIRQKGTGAVLHRVPGDTLCGANLAGADLRQADLRNTDLRNADLSFAYLPRADLSGADLRGVNLEGASLNGTILARANLSGVDFGRTLLEEVDFHQANLCGTEFRPARRRNPFGSLQRLVRFTGIQFAGAHYDSKTRWPLVMDPEQHGCIRVPDPPSPPSEVVPAASPAGLGDEGVPADPAPEFSKGCRANA